MFWRERRQGFARIMFFYAASHERTTNHDPPKRKKKKRAPAIINHLKREKKEEREICGLLFLISCFALVFIPFFCCSCRRYLYIFCPETRMYLWFSSSVAETRMYVWMPDRLPLYLSQMEQSKLWLSSSLFLLRFC